MKYRSRSDIIAAILAVVNGGGRGATKTRIMYGAFLSYTQVDEYLQFIMEKGLIARMDATSEDRVQRYVLTDKGLRFMHTFEEMADLIAPNHAQHVREPGLPQDATATA